jgi:putative heme-binding domain-containing protein
MVHTRRNKLTVLRSVIRSSVFLTVLFTTAVAWSNDPTLQPEWIWPARTRQTNQTAHFRKQFSIDGQLKRAELRVAADFNRMIIFLNGKRVARCESYGPIVSADVTPALTLGKNVLTANCVSDGGPAAVAISLDLYFEDGGTVRVVSDSTWSAALRNVDQTPKKIGADEWSNAVGFGTVATTFWNQSSVSVKIDDFDDYTQWKQALGTELGTNPSSFLVPDGFQIDLLRTARPDEGSWVSLAFDPQGRLTIAREDKGLLRLTLPKDDNSPIQVETIDETLLECRGLLYAYDSLYVNANNSKGLYRLRDTNGDDRFDEVKLLHHSPGGVGHGRNDLALGPDGMIYSIHGDAVDLPEGFTDATSPFREHRRGVQTREGHVIRTDRDGKTWELVASGLRNPYGIDFNSDGEMFTYDADAEHDMGAPWYRPTRVVQLVSGADYGWRGVTGRWPPYYPDHPDNAQPSLDIGKGSPTGVKFGTKSNFPPHYQRAFFILDWAYGRIVSVHLTAQGAGYRGHAETFIKGRPLNVTDLGFGQDGAMYVVTGGRKTRAALYRIRYVGQRVNEQPQTRQQLARIEHAAKSRTLRKKLESFHGDRNPHAVETAWPYLGSADPSIRHAARIAVEHQPLKTWKQRALNENQPKAALTALSALARSGSKKVARNVVARLNQLSLSELSANWKLTAVHIYRLCLDGIEKPEKPLLDAIIRRLNPLLPDESLPVAQSALLNRELSHILVRIDAPGAVEKTVSLLKSAKSQADELHYLFVLRNAKNGWSFESRENYFIALKNTRYYLGGDGMPKFIQQIRTEAIATLTQQEREQLGDLLAEAETKQAETPPTIARPFVREWKTVDLAESLVDVSKGRSFEQGQRMFRDALCIRCHRMRTAGDVLGPDLTSVSRRFSRKDILESIIFPSKVVAEKYRNVQIVTTEGKVITGQIIPGGDYRSPTLRLFTDPLKPNTITEIPKKSIDVHRLSETSAMPKDLLNTLTKEEILDLLAFIESAGNRNYPGFRK